MVSDICIHCGEELAIMEKNRSECWNCKDKTNCTYSDDHLEDE